MTLFQRIRTLWKLSEIKIPDEIKDDELSINFVATEKEHKMAQIIRMKNEEKIISELIEDK